MRKLVPILLLGAFLRLWLSDFKVMLPDYDPFYHARIAEIIYSTKTIPSWDAQELGGIPHYYPPVFHILIAIGKYLFFGLDFIEIGSVINVLFGVLSILIVYMMAREEFGEKIGLLSALLFAVTPMVVFRTSLWARPLGLSTFLASMSIYSFLRLSKKPDLNNGFLLLSTMLAYLFSHSSFIAAFGFLLVGLIINREKKLVKAFFGITCIAALSGVLYYYKFFPYLNFSLGYTTEYEPIIQLSSISDMHQFLVSILYLSTTNLASLPFLIHGAIICFKEKKYFIGVSIAITILLAFFKGNIFILFAFLLCIATALSLDRISTYTSKGVRYGKTLAVLLLLAIFSTHIVMNAAAHDVKLGEKTYIYLLPIKEVLRESQLAPEDVVLANDITVGHGIAYYSNASTFISVLTDTKQWSKNYEAYKKLRDENLTFSRAEAMLSENKINYLLMIEGVTGFSFVKDAAQNLEVINKATKNNVSATLYKIK